MPKWAYFAWVAMYELHQSMKALNAAANTAISQASSLAMNLVTTVEKNSGKTDTFIGELALQAISPILTLAGIFIPLPKGIGNARPAPAVHPVPPEDVGALYGLLPGAIVGAAAGIWSKLGSGTVDRDIATGALQTILVALQDNVSTVLEDINDNMFWDAGGASDLMNVCSEVLANIGDGNGRQLLGGLPGEWTLPVCAQGTNYWTWNYESGTIGTGCNAQGNGMFPCACGPHGSKTAAFLAAENFFYQNTYVQEAAMADACTDILANQPLGRGNMIHNPNSPGWDGIAGGHPATLDLGNGTTSPYGRVCTLTQAGRKCTGP